MKLLNEIILLAINNDRSGIPLVDNIIIDGLGLSRMVTKEELSLIRVPVKSEIDYQLEELFKKAA